MDLKNTEYYQITRNDVISLVPRLTRRLLSVGCGSGNTELSLKKSGIPEIICIEKNPEVAKQAQFKVDKVITADIEHFQLPFSEGYFDCIIYADILEHLIEPQNVLSEHRRFLTKDGVIIISIPNIRYYQVILNLVRGYWLYQERGILDQSHLRFFTFKSINAMLINSGYKIEKLIRNYRLVEQPSPINECFLARFLSRINFFYILRDFFTFQYLILARKNE